MSDATGLTRVFYIGATINLVKHRMIILGGLAFMSGFLLMVFEIVAARILAPTIGSSTYVWTSVIGVIIAALSAGYWLGGRIADARGRAIDIAALFGAAALLVLVAFLYYEPYLEMLATSGLDSRLQGVYASLVLFAPTSFLLGMVSPYLAKLNITSLKNSGQAVANLGALNSLGGIGGTFLTGFVLLGWMGSRSLLFCIIVAFLLLSWAVRPRQHVVWRLAISIGVLVVALLGLLQPRPMTIDTATATYRIEEHAVSGEKLRTIATGPGGYQSGVVVERPDSLAFWYTQQILQVIEHGKAPERVLVLGGGAYTLPRAIAARYPAATVDVIEIDPKLVHIARDHFYFSGAPNIHSITADGRMFLNQTTHTYDTIVVDVYGDIDVPFTFMTRQYGEVVSRALRPGGKVIANLVGGETGPCRTLIDAQTKPYLEHLPVGHMLVRLPGEPHGNVVAVFGRQSLELGAQYRKLSNSMASSYTDDFTPADRLQQACKNVARV